MIKKTIKSYLYWQYLDDDDLKAFVNSYNILSQSYIDWFNTYNLPIYISPQISGDLLDWVAQGLYGIKRPAFGVVNNIYAGTLNTWLCNTTKPNESSSLLAVKADDDIFKRSITWHFFKGDGKVFNIEWLKSS